MTAFPSLQSLFAADLTEISGSSIMAEPSCVDDHTRKVFMHKRNLAALHLCIGYVIQELQRSVSASLMAATLTKANIISLAKSSTFVFKDLPASINGVLTFGALNEYLRAPGESLPEYLSFCNETWYIKDSYTDQFRDILSHEIPDGSAMAILQSIMYETVSIQSYLEDEPVNFSCAAHMFKEAGFSIKLKQSINMENYIKHHITAD